MNQYYDMECVSRLEYISQINDKESYRNYVKQDVTYLKELYYKRTGEILCLSNPKTFNEKLQWLKIYWRDPLAYNYVDKCYLPQILKENEVEELIPERIAVFDDASQIDFRNLPYRFVLKTSHASGFNLMVTDKTLIDEERIKRVFKKLLGIKYFALKYEWPYEKVTPRILCEPLIQITDSWPIDYKFHCFNGQVKFCEILNAIPKTINEPIELIVDRDFNRMEFSFGYENLAFYQKSPDFDKMVIYAEKLSKPFPYVRVDLLNISLGKIKLGEFTFFPGAGYDYISPKVFQLKIGCWLELPSKFILNT